MQHFFFGKLVVNIKCYTNIKNKLFQIFYNLVKSHLKRKLTFGDGFVNIILRLLIIFIGFSI